MKIKELRKLNKGELESRLEKISNEMFDLRFDLRSGQEKDYASFSKKRKEVARIKTLLNEMQDKPEAKINKEIKTKQNDEK